MGNEGGAQGGNPRRLVENMLAQVLLRSFVLWQCWPLHHHAAPLCELSIIHSDDGQSNNTNKAFNVAILMRFWWHNHKTRLKNKLLSVTGLFSYSMMESDTLSTSMAPDQLDHTEGVNKHWEEDREWAEGVPIQFPYGCRQRGEYRSSIHVL